MATNPSSLPPSPPPAPPTPQETADFEQQQGLTLPPLSPKPLSPIPPPGPQDPDGTVANTDDCHVNQPPLPPPSTPPPPPPPQETNDSSPKGAEQNPNQEVQPQPPSSPPPGFSPLPLSPPPQEPDGEQLHPSISPPPGLSPAPQEAEVKPNLSPNCSLDDNPNPFPNQDQLPQLAAPSLPPPPPPPPTSSPPPPAPSVSLPVEPNGTLDDNPNPNSCTSPNQSPLQHSPTPSPPRDPENSKINSDSTLIRNHSSSPTPPPDSSLLPTQSSVPPSPKSPKSPKEDVRKVPSPDKSPPQPHSSPPPESSHPTPPPSQSLDLITKEDDDQDSLSQSPSSTPSESNSLSNSTAIPESLMLVPISMEASPPKKPIPWTHDESTNLIEAYQEKWYSLKRGQLKASQWEEVAITVAARCGYNEPSKTATQCRHKIEKLRKRYRTEKLKSRSKANSWNLFKLMDRMERGPLPISSSRPLTMIEYDDPPQRSSGSRSKKKDDSDSEFLVKCKQNKSKTVTRIAQGGNRNVNKPGVDQKLGSSGSDRVLRQLRSPVSRKQKNLYENIDEEEEDDNDADAAGVEGGDGVAQLAVQIRSFAERFVRMEKKKIEMMRDTERYRMEMENKRMEMILETQQQLVETVNRAFGSVHKKRKLASK